MEHNFTLSIDDGDVTDVSISNKKPTYRKELIYEGKFSKDDFNFSVTEELIDHWIASFETMQDAGIDVPVPVEHTSDPEKRRGTLTGVQKSLDSKGRLGLFGYIAFNDAEAAKLSASQVSIYVPKERPANGVEKPLKNVISHVCITDYPVINDLDGFEIAASLTPCKEKPKMLKKLAQELGLSLSEDTDDQGSFDAILSHVKSLSLAIEDMKKKMPPKDDEEDDEKEKYKKEVAASFAKKFAGTESSSRKTKVDALVLSGKITKAVADGLKDAYCKEESLALSFDSEGNISDSFGATIDALDKNEVVLSFNERSGSQTYSKDEDNPMLRVANERAEAFAKGTN